MNLLRSATKPLFILLAGAVLLLHSCSKDPGVNPDPGTNPVPAGKKLSKIEYDGGSYETIEYNTNGTIARITNHIEYSNGSPVHNIYSFIYTGAVLTEVRADDGSKFKYTYANQQVIKTEVYAATGNLVAYYGYAYQNGKLWRTDGYHRLPGGPISTIPTTRYENEYYATGNLQKMILYFRDPSTGTLDKTDEYVVSQYDSKNNTSALFENNPYLPLDSFIPNNPLSEVHYNANGNIEETVTHTYTYDTDGNPLTKKTVTKIPGVQDAVENTRFYY